MSQHHPATLAVSTVIIIPTASGCCAAYRLFQRGVRIHGGKVPGRTKRCSQVLGSTQQMARAWAGSPAWAHWAPRDGEA